MLFDEIFFGFSSSSFCFSFSFFEVKSKKSTNNYGYFSSKDYLINKNIVAVIGDSYVVASEVDNDETFHSLLDKEIILDDITVSKQRGEMNAEVAAYAWLGAISEIVVQWIENGKPHPVLEAFPTLRAHIFRSLDLGEQV